MSAMIASAIVADIDLDLVEAFRLNKVINDQDGTRLWMQSRYQGKRETRRWSKSFARQSIAL